MNLKKLKDNELLENTKHLVQNERDVLREILHHLREVESRKLFSDLGYSSLFDYAVRELKYGEGQAGRRIQAMKLLNELPQLESKIQSGELSLSNLSQAQSYFRQVEKTRDGERMVAGEKVEILNRLENISAREGQKVLLNLQPEMPLPKERIRPVTEPHDEVKFVMDAKLKEELEVFKSLLGPSSQHLSFAELIGELTSVGIQALKQKRFGKKESLIRKRSIQLLRRSRMA